MPCYLSVHDRQYRIIDANRRTRSDFPYEPGALCYELYKGRDGICPDCPVRDTFETGEGRRCEQLLKRRDGSEVPVLVATTPIRNDAGEIIAVM